jgi:hypothetical protein
MKIGINNFFRKSLEKIQFWLNVTRIVGTSHDDLHKFIKIYCKEMYISLLFVLYKGPDGRLIN